ncbi:MAG TPA: hypothetical protein VK153_03105 [Candidatus Paceibacterota bacterium]|nr:hypothetical protein [Candidatus Paceibacterota bacterium]
MQIKPEKVLFLWGIFFLILTVGILLLLVMFTSLETIRVMLASILSIGAACVFFILSIIYGKIVKIEEKTETTEKNKSSAQV